MARERVERAIRELEAAINDGEHQCDVHIEHLGNRKEVSFYLDGEEDETVGAFVVTPGSPD